MGTCREPARVVRRSALLRGEESGRVQQRNIDVACNTRRRRQLVEHLEQAGAAVDIGRSAQTHE